MGDTMCGICHDIHQPQLPGELWLHGRVDAAAVQLPVLVQVVIISVFVFPLLSRYESSTIGIIKASWVLGIKHVFSCFGILAIIAAAALIARTVPGLFLLVFISLTAFAIYLVVGRVMEKYRPGAV